MLLSLHFLQKASGGYFDHLHLSVCPLCYLLLNHWTKSNQICCVSLTYMNGACNSTFLLTPPHSPRPWGGVKRSNIIKFKLQSFSKLCVLLSQIKDIKHINRYFHSVAWHMPQGWDLQVQKLLYCLCVCREI